MKIEKWKIIKTKRNKTINRKNKEEKSRQDHFDRVNNLQLMSEEKTKRVGGKVIARSIDEL